MGASPFKRAIQEKSMAPLAQFIIKNPDIKKLEISLQNNKIVIE